MYVSSNPSLPIRNLLWPNGQAERSEPLESEHGVYEYSRAREALADFVSAAGMTGGDLVLLPAYICSTVLEPFLQLGIRILFYPVDEALAPDAHAIRELLRQKPRAILFVHYFGFAPKTYGLIEECRERGVWVVEDCAHTLPSPDMSAHRFFGDLAVFSLPKLLPLPDGALAIVTNRKLRWPAVPIHSNKRLTRINSLWQIANSTEVLAGVSLRTRLRHSRRTTSLLTDLREPSDTNDHAHSYSRFRMSGIARWINSKIELQSVIHRRKENYRLLVETVKSIKGVRVAFGDRMPTSAPLGLPILVEDREGVRSKLTSAGVDPRPIWSGLPPAVPQDSCAAAHHFAAHNIVLPVHQDLDQQALAHITSALQRAINV